MSKYKVNKDASPDLPADATKLDEVLDSVWNQVLVTVEPSYFMVDADDKLTISGKKPTDTTGWFVMDTSKRVSRA